MAFTELADWVNQLSVTAYTAGYRELSAVGSPYFVAEETPRLWDLCHKGIPAAFAPFHDTPDPAAFEAPIQDLRRVLRLLSPGDGIPDGFPGDVPYFADPVVARMTGAGDLIERWTGRAAREFKRAFLDRFPGRVRNQFTLVGVLTAALTAEQELWRRVRDDVVQIAKQTLGCLEALDDCGSQDWSVTLTVLSAVAGFLSALPEDVPVIAPLAGVASASSVLGTFTPDGTQGSVAGADVFGVIQSMTGLLRQEMELLARTERDIAATLAAIRAAVDGSPDEFVAPRPALADPGRSPVTGPDYLGYPD